MRHLFVSLAAFLAPVAAFAADPGADKPILGPPPAWVRPAIIPADTAKPDESAIRILLSDQQVKLLTSGAETYIESAVRVQTAQGLGALGTITLPWKPDLGTLTVHKLAIIRSGKSIDLLAGGKGFTVIRRENNLDYAMLDGVLSAVFQPEGLQVGDVLDMAYTIRNTDPTFGGNSETILFAGPGARALRAGFRVQWSTELPVRWRVGDGFPAVRERHGRDGTELALALDNVEPQILPKGAPPRFALTRIMEVSTFKDWQQLSALFAPLYAKAATLKPDSPLAAEIARIAAATPDPVHRAEAALALVQNQVRYVFLGMNDGGLVPADVDLTWQRRFADCKGKTALLLALLNGLGIAAAPAIASGGLGDGMNERLPMIGLFDHVLVRATIGGKVYWLDGTRTGDLRLADIQVPNFHFALPLRAPGATLEPLVVPIPAKPLADYVFRVDMTGGATQPFPFHVEEVTRGDAAVMTHLGIDNLTPELRQQALRNYFVEQYSDVEPKTVGASWDPATGEEKLVMDGLAKHDWQWAYEADRSGIGWSADFERTEGPHRDAPFAVAYPDHVHARETILLPNGGRGFVNATPDVHRTVAGVEYNRTSKLDGATYTMDLTRRAVAREFPAAEAPAAQAALRQMAKQQALLGLNGALYQPTAKEVAAMLATDPQTAVDYLRRAQARLANKDADGATADVSRAIELAPTLGPAYVFRAVLYGHAERGDEALADAQKAVVLSPELYEGHALLGELLLARGKFADALTELDRALILKPDEAHALAVRAETHRKLGHFDQSLIDSAAALKAFPGQIEIYETRINVYVGLNQRDKALAEARAAVAANPASDFAHVLLGATYTKMGHQDEAMTEFARAIAIKPTPYGYLTRAGNRAQADVAGRRADIAAALRLDPSNAAAQRMNASTELRAKNYPAAMAAANAILAKNSRDGETLWLRGVAASESGRSADAEKDFAAARDVAGGDAQSLNNMCWEKAMMNVALASALADCDAALKLAPDAGYIVDSRAFALFRLGRYQDALAVYDRSIALVPKEASSLYMRGVTKRRLGKTAEGDADIVAAKALNPKADRRFVDAGITP